MADLPMNFSRGIAASVFALILLALPAAAIAAVDIDPGTTASDLVADGGNIIEECADTTTETCTVVINEAGNEVGALVDVTADGTGVASGEVFADFNITGGGDGALIGSFLSTDVDVSGVLSGLGPNASASVKASLEVMDTTADVMVAVETVVDDSITDGSLSLSGANAVVMSLPLTVGHSYRVSLIIKAQAVGSPGDAAGAVSDFANTASWSGLSVTAGADPFALISQLDVRVIQLETDVVALEERVDGIAADVGELDQKVEQLRDDFDNHSHTYLTGKGTGHNNTEVETGTPVVLADEPGDDVENGDDGDGVASENDLCPGTPAGAEVDADGCELAAFCSLQERMVVCSKADWRGDEPRNARDCRWRRNTCEAF